MRNKRNGDLWPAELMQLSYWAELSLRVCVSEATQGIDNL